MTLQPFAPPEALVPGVPVGMPDGAAQIVAWANTANAAASLVERLIDTPFVPVSFWPLPPGVQIRDFPNPRVKHPRESPEEFALRRQGAGAAATAAMLHGGEIGYSPLASLSAVYVVRGRPGLYAEAMAALVKSKGHELVVEELTNTRCVVRGRRKGDAEWQRFSFDMARAEKAGYVRQNPKYRDDPQSMLLPRCLSIACRAIAPDVLKGLAAVEDLTDEPDPGAAPVAARKVQRRSRAVAAAPAAPALPEARGETVGNPAASTVTVPPSGPPLPGEDTPAPEEPVPSTTTQHREIGRLLADLGIVGEGSRSARAARVSGIVGRPVDSATQLTTVEADQVISTLAADVELDRRIAETRQQQPADDGVPVEDPPAGVDPESGEVLVDWPPENGADQ